MYESEVTKDELPLCRSRSSLCRNFGCVGSFLLVTTQTGLYILVWMLTELVVHNMIFKAVCGDFLGIYEILFTIFCCFFVFKYNLDNVFINYAKQA